ncbi:MAG: hypothetical protein ACI841_005270 [Planctomycetota bacterium]
MTEDKRLLYCHCAYAKVVPAKVKAEVLKRLGASGRDFEAVPDLCEMSARKDPALADYAGDESLHIVACYPRALRWLFHAAGHELKESIGITNMREQTADEIDQALQLSDQQAVAGQEAAAVQSSEATQSSGASNQSSGTSKTGEATS